MGMSGDWESAWRQCEERFKTYNWIHAYPNAAAEIIALWFGSSFDEMIHIIARTMDRTVLLRFSRLMVISRCCIIAVPPLNA